MPVPRPSKTRRLYRLLLRLLPSDFRAEFGHEMEGVFVEQRAAASSPRLVTRLWLRTVGGMLATAPRQHADVLAQDGIYACRTLARTPIFTATAVLSLALAIGATVAVFTLVHRIVLAPLPVASPEGLVWFDNPSFSYPIVREVERQVASLEGIFAWTIDRLNVSWTDTPESTDVLLASSAIHEVLGLTPAAGRLLARADAESEPVAVLSHGAWARRFGADPAVIGRVIRVGQVPVTVVGVTPRGFSGVAAGFAPDITIPVTLAPRVASGNDEILHQPTRAWLHIMGRLRASTSLAEANAALAVTWPRVLDAATPAELPPDRRARFLSRQTRLVEGSTGFSSVRREFARALWVLFGLATLILVAAVVAVANMVLSRTLARAHELSLRRAIGAGRARVLRQLLTESALLAVAGTALGLLLAVWGSGALTAAFSTSEQSLSVSTMPDRWVVGVTAGLGLLIVVVLTAAAAACALAAGPSDALRSSPRLATGSRAHRRLGNMLVATQVSLAMVLVAGAALFVADLRRLDAASPGFDRGRVLLVHADALFAGYVDRLPSFFEGAAARLAALPGVESVSYSWVPPISRNLGSWTQRIEIDGRAAAGEGHEHGSQTLFNAVSPAYFETTGIPLLAGRIFTPRDDRNAPRVAIVSAAFVTKYLAGGPALGRRVSIGRDASRQDLLVVGVVQNSKYQWMHDTARPTVYLPYNQTASVIGESNLIIEVRTADSPAAAAPAVRTAMREFDRRVPLRVETLESRIAESLVRERALAGLGSALGVIALVLAGAALYGLSAYAAARRTREIGVRIALGAAAADIRRLLVSDTLTVVAAGLAVGLALTAALGRSVGALLTSVTPWDPAPLSGAVALVSVVSVVGAVIPALHGARTNPLVALRAE